MSSWHRTYSHRTTALPSITWRSTASASGPECPAQRVSQSERACTCYFHATPIATPHTAHSPSISAVKSSLPHTPHSCPHSPHCTLTPSPPAACRWSRSVAWARDTVVRWEGEVFRAEGPINVAIPGNSSHEYFYVSLTSELHPPDSIPPNLTFPPSPLPPSSPPPSPLSTSAGTLPVTSLHLHLAGCLGNGGSVDVAGGSLQVPSLAPVPIGGCTPLSQLLPVL